MSVPSTSETVSDSEPPLWSIAMVVVIILVAPLVLYSFAPTGPIRDGDTVFSSGEQRARIHSPASRHPAGKEETCVLDPDSPLIVLQSARDQTDASIIAEVQGNSAGEWPFCPVHTEVIVHTQQIFQKPAVFGSLREIVVGFFGR
ncbi:MAG: hypothetical protein QM706_09410 [Nitrospira sp.]